MVVAIKSKTDREGLEHLKPQVLEELNVKDIDFVDTAAELEKPGYTVMTEGDVAVASVLRYLLNWLVKAWRVRLYTGYRPCGNRPDLRLQIIS